MVADFSGYATKAGLKCSDGRTIMPEAFESQGGETVPLVWKHMHDSPDNVLGHAVLEKRADGVYAYGFFNTTNSAKTSRELVEHGDITAMSIYANDLVQKGDTVFHGVIREVSLVLSGANPGAKIENVNISHSDGEIETLDDEALIFTGLTLEHADQTAETSKTEEKKADEKPKDEEEPSLEEIYNSMSTVQKNAVNFMIGVAVEDNKTDEGDKTAKHSSDSKDSDDEKEEKKGDTTMGNVFEQDKSKDVSRVTLSHEDVKGIVADAMKGGSLKTAVESYAIQHGITNLDLLFPDAKSVTATPEFDSRRTEWVAGVLNGTHHSPFSRVKKLTADITHEEARARGYIKGSLKKEEYFSLSSRVTTPTTVYKKQKLDRDDIVDITDFDIVAWLRGEMRLMLDEELARAVLIGDGRESMDEDKIKDPAGATEGSGIRSILHDHDLYAATITVNVGDAGSSSAEIVDAVLGSMRFYKGSGSPTLYTTLVWLNKIMLQRDSLGRKLYKTEADVAAEMGVGNIVTVEVMESEPDLVGIIVNLRDYTIGADKGGNVSMFDDFDIDYNQYKYLIETRVSGGLTKLRSAIIVQSTGSANVIVIPTPPTFVEATGVVTIPTKVGVKYTDASDASTLSPGAQTALQLGDTLEIVAEATTGYYLGNNVEDTWSFTGVTDIS